MKGRPVLYSEVEENFLRRHAEKPRRNLHSLFVAQFGRGTVSFDQIKAKCTRMGLKTGRTGCFAAGHVPANKGHRGFSAPGSARTQFKPGNVPANTKPLGYERICSKNGYILIKVAEPNPYTGAKTRMLPKHRHMWAQAHGPIPDRHVVRFMNGDPMDVRLDNLICVPLSVNARLNVESFNDAPIKLRETLLAQALLKDRIGELEPSAMQRTRRKPGYVPPSAATPPAENLRDLIEETVFYFDVGLIAPELDQAIARTVAAKGWAINIAGLIPDGASPTVIHIDRGRLKGRADLRNRLRVVLAELEEVAR